MFGGRGKETGKKEIFTPRASLQTPIPRYNVSAMSEQEKDQHELDLKKMFELNEREKEGAVYIVGVVVLLILIVVLASLTNIVLKP